MRTPGGGRRDVRGARASSSVVNVQSVAASFVSPPSGIREQRPVDGVRVGHARGSAVPSTRSYVWPVDRRAVISPSYESASSSVPVAVSTSATPSGAPFCASIVDDEVARPRRASPVSVDPLVLGAVAAVHEHERDAVERRRGRVAVFAISTNPPTSAPTWS